MGKERDSNYYNTVWTNTPKWQKDWNQVSRVRTRLYESAGRLIEEGAPLVIDFGCGAGHFAQCLINTRYVKKYVGYDFSEAAILKAKQRIGPYQASTFTFSQADLRVMRPTQALPDGAVFVCLETLEHIEADLRIFSLVPDGHRMVISVPAFDEESHVRHFERWDKVLARYGAFFDPSTISYHPVWKWHLFTGIRHDDTTKAPAQTNLFQ
jgi:trans-aconitate methyltransferase